MAPWGEREREGRKCAAAAARANGSRAIIERRGICHFLMAGIGVQIVDRNHRPARPGGRPAGRLSVCTFPLSFMVHFRFR